MQDEGIIIENTASGRNWRLRKYDELSALAISQGLQLPSLVAQILSSRGYTKQNVEEFLNPTLRKSLPDPSILKDMDQAVSKIIQTIKENRKIAIFGDYDVDGATSSALLHRYFRQIGVDTIVYIPDRLDEGYGPTRGAFEKLKKEGVSVVITVDCGTTAFDPLEYAQELGLEVVVVDHHVAEPKLPKAAAIVNPNRLDEPQNPAQTLAAVGVSFLLIVALNRALRSQGYFSQSSEPNLMELLDLVSLGTVCDVMPLKGLNRAFVKQGLKVLAKRTNTGLKALMDLTGLDTQPSAYHLGFLIGPRINAGGRVGEASLGSQLLRTDDERVACEIAKRLDEYNALRKEVEQEVLDECIHQAKNQTSSIIVAAGLNWHPGVIGIVAGRLKEQFNKPACVVSLDKEGIGKGSARSVPGLDLGSMIHAARQSGLLMAGGGHAMAAGFTIEEGNLIEFQNYLSAKYESNLSDKACSEIDVDAVLNIRSVTVELAQKLELLAPFGPSNPNPKFAILNARIVKSDVVGANHVRLIVGQLDGAQIPCIAFRSLETELGKAILSNRGFPVNLLGTVKRDSWMGREKVQFIVEDIAEAKEAYSKVV